MLALLKRFAIGLGQVVAGIALLFAIYGGWALWETHTLETFCGTVHAGDSTSKLRTLLEDAGYGSDRVDRALKIPDPPGYVVFLPAASTFGEETCAIYFNHSEVTSAGIQW